MRPSSNPDANSQGERIRSDKHTAATAPLGEAWAKILKLREKTDNAQGVIRRCTLKSASWSVHHASTDHPARAASE